MQEKANLGKLENLSSWQFVTLRRWNTIYLLEVGRKISLGREMVPLDNPYIHFLFLLAIAYLSQWTCLQSHQMHYGCMFYMPYICIFYLWSWIKLHRHFFLSITVFTSCAQFHLSISFWREWAVVRLTCSVFTLSKIPHHRSFQE